MALVSPPEFEGVTVADDEWPIVVVTPPVQSTSHAGYDAYFAHLARLIDERGPMVLVTDASRAKIAPISAAERAAIAELSNKHRLSDPQRAGSPIVVLQSRVARALATAIGWLTGQKLVFTATLGEAKQQAHQQAVARGLVAPQRRSAPGG
jgi:hypothetical protein